MSDTGAAEVPRRQEHGQAVAEKKSAGGREMSATMQSVDTNPGGEQELTDGFHLIIDALKLNGVKTIYAVPGIPITDFLRMSQAEGIRVLSFRHEQNAGYAASIAGYASPYPRRASLTA
jgi:hypothetical protein